MAGMTRSAASAEARRALLEQLTERLRRQGFRHPDAAAVAWAARGDAGGDLASFCSAHRIDPERWEAAERGDLELGTVLRLSGGEPA